MRRRWGKRLASMTMLALLAGWAAWPQAALAHGMIVYQTDFGLRDSAVAEMKGVAKQVDPTLELYDNTHEIPPFDIWAGAVHLAHVIPYWPKDTVFVSVVDPGVGTQRGAVVARLKSGHLYVGPDNGTLTLAAEQIGIAEVRRIDEAKNRLAGSEQSHTFHGRDIFSYTAARLASGQIRFEEVGPILAGDVVTIPYQHAAVDKATVLGTIPILDVNFGNVWTNISRTVFESLGIAKGEPVHVRIQNADLTVFDGVMPFVDTFGDVPEGQPLVYVNSVDEMAIAINYGDFAAVHKVDSGPNWKVMLSKPS